MRIVAISILALVTLSGCMTVHAYLPDEMVRHIARKDGVELGAICSHEGRSFSEGAVAFLTLQHSGTGTPTSTQRSPSIHLLPAATSSPQRSDVCGSMGVDS